ncbi:MAG: hypothetical protein V1836_02290 [Candidatus Aenigmatarchaeota archaeon]
MISHKTLFGALLVAIGIVAISGNILNNYISVPPADIWLPALIIVIAGTLPALLIIVGSLLIWGEMEEKKVEKDFVKIEKNLERKISVRKKRKK